jgi:heme exporter protein A
VAALFRLEAIAVNLGPIPIISEITADLEPGECLGIRGPNGAGKTTLLRVMATLLRPSAGSGEVLGARLGTATVIGIRTGIGLMGHQPALAASLTLFENLMLAARLRAVGEGEVRTALDRVGLIGAADRIAAVCSQGMLRRADLARLFIQPPRLLLLDEPHAGLDDSAQPLVAALIDRTTGNGGGAVLVSHDPRGLLGLTDRQVDLRMGRLEPVA